ncbi:hypothetical protein EDB80DRAFT_433977 [Ilyonectria destructans]|nr:hypothetical protein EDB80DRAFT_433977 [Ilyonectria destructans]
MLQKEVPSTAPVAKQKRSSRSARRQVKNKRQNQKPDASRNTTKDDKANLSEGDEGRTFTLGNGSLYPAEWAVQGEYDFLCSYTWVKGIIPAIHVPGELPEYTPTVTSLETKEGTVGKWRFAAPKYLFEASFRALESMRPKYTFDDIDLVTNRGTLAKLITFSSGTYRLEDFGLKLYMIKNTLFIETCDPDLDGTINRPPSLGHDFERAVTQPHANDTGTHHRFLRYNMGSLKCAVICEVDASCAYPNSGEFGEDRGGGGEEIHGRAGAYFRPREFQETRGGAARKINNLAGAKASKTKNEALVDAGFHVIPHGSPIPHSMTAEIKTIVSPKIPERFLQQLWLTRQYYIILGFHERSEPRAFYRTQFKVVSDEIRVWEQNNKANLGKTVTLIYLLGEQVKNSAHKTCSAVYQEKRTGAKSIQGMYGKNNRELRVSDAKTRRVPLPADLISKFWQSE